MPLAPIGAELLFEVISQRYEQGPILVTTSYPSTSGPMYSDRLTHHVHILDMNGESYRP